MMSLNKQIDDLMERWDRSESENAKLRSGVNQIIDNLTYDIDFEHTQRQRDGMAMLNRNIAYRLLERPQGEVRAETSPHPDPDLNQWDKPN